MLTCSCGVLLVRARITIVVMDVVHIVVQMPTIGINHMRYVMAIVAVHSFMADMSSVRINHVWTTVVVMVPIMTCR